MAPRLPRNKPKGNSIADLTHDTFVQADAHAAAALRAARRTVGLRRDDPVIALADEFEAALHAGAALTGSAAERARELAADDKSQPAGLDAAWGELRSAHESAAGTIRQRLHKAAAGLEANLYRRAIPTSRSDAAAVLARQDVDAALAANPGREAEALATLAAQGGEAAAAATSGWARDRLAAISPGLAAEHGPTVVATAIRSSLSSEDESLRQAAEGFMALDGMREAAGLAEAALHMASQDLRTGRHAHAERWRDTHDRHADLREMAGAPTS